MGSFSIWHWLIVLVIIVLLFGRNRIPAVMGDLAKGIKAFKSGMKEKEEEEPAQAPKSVTSAAMPGAESTLAKDEAKG